MPTISFGDMADEVVWKCLRMGVMENFDVTSFKIE